MKRQHSKNLTDYRIMATFVVRYKINDKWHILQPGQLIPVWSGVHWMRNGPDLEVCLMTVSVDPDGELVNLPGRPQISQEKYLIAKRSGSPDREESQILSAAKVTPLGGLSRFSIMRPHRLPIGVGMFQDEISIQDRRPQWESKRLTMAQAIEPAQKFKRQSETILPMPRLFVASSAGSCKGVDVLNEGRVLCLKETLLPVAPVPFDENGEAQDMMEYAVAADRHLNRLGKDVIYIGYGIYPNHDITGRTIKVPVDLDTHRHAHAMDQVLYVLPHGSADDYAEDLKMESRVRLEALFQGQDELADYTIPVPEFIAGMPIPTTDIVPEWERVDHDLHESGLV